MAQIFFFATKDDLLPVLNWVESRIEVKYVEWKSRDTPCFEFIYHGSEIPDLGVATNANAVGSVRYLIVDKNSKIAPRENRTMYGIVYGFDTADAVLFWPGGRYTDEVMLNGSFGASPFSSSARLLLAPYQSAIRKRFIKVGAYWVGPEAYGLLEAGVRFASGTQGPPEYDLKVRD